MWERHQALPEVIAKSWAKLGGGFFKATHESFKAVERSKIR